MFGVTPEDEPKHEGKATFQPFFECMAVLSKRERHQTHIAKATSAVHISVYKFQAAH